MLRKKCRYRCKEISVLQQQITLLQNELTAIKGMLTGKGSLKDLKALRLKPTTDGDLNCLRSKLSLWVEHPEATTQKGLYVRMYF